MPATPKRTITKKQYRDAYVAFCAYVAAMCDAAKTKYPHLDFHWDEIVALNIATAAYDDIDRYKSYHLRNRPGLRSNVVKRASYFCKWTARFRPIMFKRIGDPPAGEDMGLLINETLATAWAMELISEDLGRNVRLSLKSMDELLYDLHYREVGNDALLGWFQLVVDLAEANKANPIVELGL
jgi:hypothetical protein